MPLRCKGVIQPCMTVLLILLTPFAGQPVLLTGLLLSALLAIKLVGRHRAGGVVRKARAN
jgi:hypothetical protein